MTNQEPSFDFAAMFATARSWIQPIMEAAQDADLDRESVNEGWTTRMLLAHIINELDMFARGLRGEDVTNDGPANLTKPFAEDAIGDAFREGADDLWAAAHEPGNAERTVLLPMGPRPGAIIIGMGASELALHGWDVAQSIGVEAVIPEALSEPLVAFNRPATAQLVERGAYKPEIDVPEDATWHTRLLAVAGRRG